jgi:diguanylate cyclase (GGDEF)-like protein/PAS domain S-box-containing protein
MKRTQKRKSKKLSPKSTKRAAQSPVLPSAVSGLLASVCEKSTSGLLVTDANQNIIFVNDALTRISGYPTAELIGKKPSVLKSDKHEAEFFQNMWKSLKANATWHGEILNRTKEGTIVPFWLNINTISDAAGEPVNYLGILTPMTGMTIPGAYLDHLKYYDALTELPNRFLFQDRLEHALLGARRAKEHVLILFMDLDNFKLVNESMGHVSGDTLLKEASHRLMDCVRKGETLARMGGDEFAIILTDIKEASLAPKAAAAAAQRLITALAEPLALNGTDFFVSLSIGISVFPDDAQTGEDLVRNAEAAMYHAKQHGRGNYQFYATHMNEKVKERVTIISKLHRSLDHREFSLNFQPQVDIRNFNNPPALPVTGVETLLRWNTVDLGQVSPANFIPLLEETRLILPVGRWVLQNALEQYLIWYKQGIAPARIGVNISALQFEERDLAQLVSDIISSSQVPPQSVELELTEGTIMSHSEKTLNTLNALKEIGVTVSIDDFGTGYSSINYLKRFPIDRLKVDRSFIMDIPADKDDMAITSAVIAMAHSLDLDVVAEGVETKEQLQYLVENQCDEVQGYFFSKPLSADACTEFLKKMNTNPTA